MTSGQSAGNSIVRFKRPEGCSYRMALLQIKKAYPGHARRVMMGVWSHLRQFMYTKFIVVVDDDVNVHDWKEVIWALTTRVDPVRDTMMVENTPIVRQRMDRIFEALGL